MSVALPQSEPCCTVACDSVLVQNIPGSPGEDGVPGENGADGISALTTITDPAGFDMPAEGATQSITVLSTAGFVIGENVFIQGLGTLQVTAIGSAITATLQNLKVTATGVYAANAAPGTNAALGSRVGMTGLQGPTGILSGSALGGDIKGTYPNLVKLAIPNSLGALVVGNGNDAVSLSAGTAGFVPVNDAVAFMATGLGHKKILPVTGDANVAADRLARLSAATGLPIPLVASKASIKDPGGLGLIVADATTGNARGTDAVDLQVNHINIGAVASGAQAVILGGEENTASGQRSIVVGGQNNLVSGIESFIGGGEGNQVDSTQSTIVGGDTNTILGGVANESSIGGGRLNAITGNGQATIAGGFGNAVSAQYGTVAGGTTNSVSGDYGSIVGGGSNTVSGFSAAIIGGSEALADKYAQRAYAGGRFAAKGDCQQSDLIWRITTTNATITEAFLDGNSLRATIPNGKTWAFSILVTARDSAGVSAAWTVIGAIQNVAGTTALVAAVTTTVIADGTGASWGVAGGVTVDADNANDALRIRVTGPAAPNVRWGIHGRIMEIGY